MYFVCAVWLGLVVIVWRERKRDYARPATTIQNTQTLYSTIDTTKSRECERAYVFLYMCICVPIGLGLF